MKMNVEYQYMNRLKGSCCPRVGWAGSMEALYPFPLYGGLLGLLRDLC